MRRFNRHPKRAARVWVINLGGPPVEDFLRERDYCVESYDDAGTAVRQLSTPRVIIVAGAVEGSNAGWAVGALRKRFAGITIVALVPAGPEWRVGALQAGADDVMSAPISLQELYLRLRGLLG